MTQQPTQTKTRTPSMKWIKLSEGKDPDFDKPLFLTNGEIFYAGLLTKIERTPDGKKYFFSIGPDGSGEEVITDRLTHYCYPVSPAK